MIRAFILWESRTTRTRIQLDTTRNIEVFLNEVVNTIIWTRNNNGQQWTIVQDWNKNIKQEDRLGSE